jgi:hypothetical protein
MLRIMFQPLVLHDECVKSGSRRNTVRFAVVHDEERRKETNIFELRKFLQNYVMKRESLQVLQIRIPLIISLRILSLACTWEAWAARHRGFARYDAYMMGRN